MAVFKAEATQPASTVLDLRSRAAKRLNVLHREFGCCIELLRHSLFGHDTEILAELLSFLAGWIAYAHGLSQQHSSLACPVCKLEGNK